MQPDDHSRLSCSNVRVTVPGRLLVDALTMTAKRGEVIAVLGQNGAGKSLTLLTLAGLREPDSGTVALLGHDIFAARRQLVARHLALLPQNTEDIFPASVLETALIGRHPHIGRFGWETAEDYAIADTALHKMGLGDMSNRDVLTLSGGERRRLAIAQILTQAPDVYLLDEPSNHLDPQHQLDTLRIFRRAADEGVTVIASLHDVNLAVRFADRCLLLFGDGRWELGDSGDILNEANLSDLYATTMEGVSWRERTLFIAATERTNSV